jgi:hypothetical protein
MAYSVKEVNEFEFFSNKAESEQREKRADMERLLDTINSQPTTAQKMDKLHELVGVKIVDAATVDSSCCRPVNPKYKMIVMQVWIALMVSGQVKCNGKGDMMIHIGCFGSAWLDMDYLARNLGCDYIRVSFLSKYWGGDKKWPFAFPFAAHIQIEKGIDNRSAAFIPSDKPDEFLSYCFCQKRCDESKMAKEEEDEAKKQKKREKAKAKKQRQKANRAAAAGGGGGAEEPADPVAIAPEPEEPYDPVARLDDKNY